VASEETGLRRQLSDEMGMSAQPDARQAPRQADDDHAAIWTVCLAGQARREECGEPAWDAGTDGAL